MRAHPDQIGGPDRNGRIKVAIEHDRDRDPVIQGYKAWWVNIVLTRSPQRITTYKLAPMVPRRRA